MRNPSIKHVSALFLRVAIVLIGIASLVFLLVMPNFEGRNVNATLFQVYFNDPFLAYVYVGSIPFFVALYHAFTLLGSVGRNSMLSSDSVKRLRTIRNCGIALVALIIGAEAWIVITMGGTDDIAGGVAMGVFATIGSVGMVLAAVFLERRARPSPGMKSKAM